MNREQMLEKAGKRIELPSWIGGIAQWAGDAVSALDQTVLAVRVNTSSELVGLFRRWLVLNEADAGRQHFHCNRNSRGLDRGGAINAGVDAKLSRLESLHERSSVADVGLVLMPAQYFIEATRCQPVNRREGGSAGEDLVAIRMLPLSGVSVLGAAVQHPGRHARTLSVAGPRYG